MSSPEEAHCPRLAERTTPPPPAPGRPTAAKPPDRRPPDHKRTAGSQGGPCGHKHGQAYGEQPRQRGNCGHCCASRWSSPVGLLPTAASLGRKWLRCRGGRSSADLTLSNKAAFRAVRPHRLCGALDHPTSLRIDRHRLRPGELWACFMSTPSRNSGQARSSSPKLGRIRADRVHDVSAKRGPTSTHLCQRWAHLRPWFGRSPNLQRPTNEQPWQRGNCAKPRSTELAGPTSANGGLSCRNKWCRVGLHRFWGDAQVGSMGAEPPLPLEFGDTCRKPRLPSCPQARHVRGLSI